MTSPESAGENHPPAAVSVVALVGTVLVTGLAVVRLSNAAIPSSWFDVDPATVEAAAWGLLPGARLSFDALMLVGSALIFAGRARPASRLLCVVAMLPVPLVLWYGWSSPPDLEQGSLWIASVLSALALAHAATDSRLRIIGASIVIAGLGLLLARALCQVVWEIPETIAWFEAHRDEVFAMRGLEAGDSAAELFQRRLFNAAPTAWFSTANLLASVMAAGAVTTAALALASLRARMASGITGLVAFASVAMIAMVLATGSRGGIVVLIIGGGFLVASHTLPHWRRIGGWIAVGLVILALLAAPVAGLVGDFPGSRSLVIRSGYITGAAEIVATAPERGVGPGGFGEAWLRVRSPASPEEIESPHALPWDWAVALGIVSLAWIGLVLVALIWSVRQPRSRPPIQSNWPLSMIAAGAASVVGLGWVVTQLPQLASLEVAEAVVWVMGWLAFVSGAGGLAWLWSRLDGGLSNSLSVAALVLLLHAQVEMTIAAATTAPWVLAVVGLAAPLSPIQVARGGGRTRPIWSQGFAAVVLVLAGVIASIGAWPALRAERLVEAQGLMVSASATLPSGAAMLSARQAAANSLLEAAAIRDDDRLRLVAAEQLFSGLQPALAAASPASLADVHAARQRVVALARSVHMRTNSVPAGHLAMTALQAFNDSADRREAVEVATSVVAADPAGLWSVRHLADALWESGDRDVAAEVYTQVLRLNDARSIDPLRQLSESDRQLVDRRARWSP